MIKRLYSETGLIGEDYLFHTGLNIIIGKYAGGQKPQGVNGIGKSSLVRLIDYLLLSDSVEALFSQDRYNFLCTENHNIVLEISIENETYVIKRAFKESNKVIFGKLSEPLNEYSKAEIKLILNDKLFPIQSEEVCFEGNRYGTLISFFIKDDLENSRRENPLLFMPFRPNVRERALYNLFLLNLPTRQLIDLDGYVKEYDEKYSLIEQLRERIYEETKHTVDEYKSEKIKIEENIEILEKCLSEFRFEESYKKIEGQIIDLTNNIDANLKSFNSLNRKLKKIKESSQYSSDIDTLEIQKLYGEVQKIFGDLVKKSLDEVIEFKKSLLANRNKYLYQKEKVLQLEVTRILEEISDWEKERSHCYKLLEEKGALGSISNTYEQLIEKKTNLERNVQGIKQISDTEEKLSEIDVSISEIKRDILIRLKEYSQSIDELRRLFQEILDNALFLGEGSSKSYFDISPTHSSKRNQLPFNIEVVIPKADALGQFRLKLVAYDLMVFLHSILQDRKLPKFLIHDGVFHGVARKTLVNTVNYVYQKSLELPKFQYILTFNEDEIDIPQEKVPLYGAFKFNIEDYVVATFADNQDKTLFRRMF